jgi:RNA polymerase sigma-70 factor, ECF subfamily
MRSEARLPEAVGALWAQWKRYVFGAFLRVLDRSDTAEDLTQQVFLAVCQTLYRGEEIRDMRAYLAATVSYVLRQHFRTRPREVSMDTSMTETLADPETRAAESPDTAAVRAFLRRLPSEERSIVVAWHYLGMTRSQIGEMLGLPRTTVNRRYAEAIQRLREMAEQHAMKPLGGPSVEPV